VSNLVITFLWLVQLPNFINAINQMKNDAKNRCEETGEFSELLAMASNKH
jgi:hypothetical protein